MALSFLRISPEGLATTGTIGASQIQIGGILEGIFD
jgi:hypothetical protein